MRVLVAAMALALAGCATTAPQIVQESLAAQLEDLQALEREVVLKHLPTDIEQDFGTPENPVVLPVQRGWQIQVQAWQIRAAALLAWSRGEKFDLAVAREAVMGGSDGP